MSLNSMSNRTGRNIPAQSAWIGRLTAGAIACLMAVSPAFGQQAEQNICVAYESGLFAQRGDVAVTQADFDGFLEAQVPPERRQKFLSSPERIGDVLETLLSTYAMAERGRASELMDRPEFQAELYIAVARQMATSYRSQYLEENALDSYEGAGRELYVADPSKFMTSRTFDFHHILIPTESNEPNVELLRKALDVHDRIESGESFEAVAADLASSAEQQNQIMLTDMALEELVAPLRTAIRGGSEGDLLAPVRSQYGWHITRIAAINEPTQLSWEQAKAEAARMARQDHHQLLLEQLRKDLHASEAEIAEGAVAELLARYEVSWPEGTGQGRLIEGMNAD